MKNNKLRNKKDFLKFIQEQEVAPQQVALPVIPLKSLLRTNYPDINWAVYGLIPEGLNFLVGPPKVKKSFFALQIALAICTGTDVMEGMSAAAGSVLYLALEDSERRLQERAGLILAARDPAFPLDFATEWPRASEEGLDMINNWINMNRRDAKLVIIDTYAKFRDPRSQNNIYDDDYGAAGILQKFAIAWRIALLVLHHSNKREETDDILSRISGTNAIAGCADTLLMLTRKRESDEAQIYMTGRDLKKEGTLDLRWRGNTCTWGPSSGAQVVTGYPAYQEENKEEEEGSNKEWKRPPEPIERFPEPSESYPVEKVRDIMMINISRTPGISSRALYNSVYPGFVLNKDGITWNKCRYALESLKRDGLVLLKEGGYHITQLIQ